MSPFNRTSANQTPEATALSNPGNLYGLQVGRLFDLSAGIRLLDSACGQGCKAEIWHVVKLLNSQAKIVNWTLCQFCPQYYTSKQSALHWQNMQLWRADAICNGLQLDSWSKQKGCPQQGCTEFCYLYWHQWPFPASQPFVLPQPGLCIACRCVQIGAGLFDATFTQLHKAHLHCYLSHSSFPLQSVSWPWSP